MFSNVYAILLYAVVSLAIFYALRGRMRVVWLLAASVFFYALCDYMFALLLLAEIGGTFFIGQKIAQLKGAGKGAKQWMVAGVALLLLILCAFKYFDFFISAFQLSLMHIVIPLGISYYSFKMLSYMADVYLGKREVEKSFVDYAVYVAFFPHLLCGPIARSAGMTAQMKEGLAYNPELFQKGLLLIVSGLFKKVVVADRIGGYVDTIFSTHSNQPSLALILAAVLYSIQLYCDFCGYSEVAIGITNLFGFRCDDNFKRPYFSLSIKDFWRRWHISLSSWLRDYIYIPLGGSRCAKWKTYRNVMVTFLVCGIWHGNALHYVAWGAYHGVMNVVAPNPGKGPCGMFKAVGYWFVTMVFIVVGWIFFRADSLADACVYLKDIVCKFAVSTDVIIASILPFTYSNACASYFLITVFLIAFLAVCEFMEERGKQKVLPVFALQLLFVIMLGFTGNSSFLYANY